MKPEWCDRAYTIGAFHDIGKLNVPSSLLNKVEPLTVAEFEILKNHTIYGYEILQQLANIPSDFPEITLYHHENIDGSGYYGKKGKDIPLLSRMIRIVDTYDTMFNGRIYQKSVSQKHVIMELTRLSGKTYDEDLVRSFVQMINGMSKNILISAR